MQYCTVRKWTLIKREFSILWYNAMWYVESRPTFQRNMSQAASKASKLCLPPRLTLLSFLAYSSTLKMEATCSSETWINFQRTTRFISQKIELFIPPAVRTSNPTDTNIHISAKYETIYCLRSLERWDRGFESHSRHGCLCALFCVCVVLCVGSGLAMGWSLVQGILQSVYKLGNWKSGQGPQRL
jgi:hypothetical protein